MSASIGVILSVAVILASSTLEVLATNINIDAFSVQYTANNCSIKSGEHWDKVKDTTLLAEVDKNAINISLLTQNLAGDGNNYGFIKIAPNQDMKGFQVDLTLNDTSQSLKLSNSFTEDGHKCIPVNITVSYTTATGKVCISMQRLQPLMSVPLSVQGCLQFSYSWYLNEKIVLGQDIEGMLAVASDLGCFSGNSANTTVSNPSWRDAGLRLNAVMTPLQRDIHSKMCNASTSLNASLVALFITLVTSTLLYSRSI